MYAQALPWIKDKVTYCHGIPAGVFLLTFAIAAVGFWQLVVRAPAVSYGEPYKTVLKPVQVGEGEEFELCFSGIVWKRLCHGTLSTYLTPTFGSRIDLPIHVISTPTKKGPIVDEDGRIVTKCRKYTAPLLNGRTGPFTFNAHASFTCTLDGAPDIVLPGLKLDIKKKS